MDMLARFPGLMAHLVVQTWIVFVIATSILLYRLRGSGSTEWKSIVFTCVAYAVAAVVASTTIMVISRLEYVYPLTGAADSWIEPTSAIVSCVVIMAFTLPFKINLSQTKMGAKHEETCGFCGTEMNQGATVCTGCNARRVTGMTGKEKGRFAVLAFVLVIGSALVTQGEGVIYGVAAAVILPIVAGITMRNRVSYVRKR